jgi:rhamnogalacturonyl hydrolase YesR
MNIKVVDKRDPWLLVKVQRDGDDWDEAIIKALNPSKYEVGQEYNGILADYHSTKEDGRIAYEEKEAPVFIDRDGKVGIAPKVEEFSKEEYLIALVEVMAVAVFDSAKIDMDLEGIRLLATAQAAKNRG